LNPAGLVTFKDFIGKSCTRGDQCMPPDVCQPIVLKAVVDTLHAGTNENRIQRLYDLGWSPKDEPYRVNNSPIELFTRLGSNAPNYLGSQTNSLSLRARLGRCIHTFANIIDRNFDTKMDNWQELPGDCPPPLGNWWRSAPPGQLWWDAS